MGVIIASNRCTLQGVPRVVGQVHHRPSTFYCCSSTLDYRFYSNCHISLKHFDVFPSPVNDLLILTSCRFLFLYTTHFFSNSILSTSFCLLFHNNSGICVNFSASADQKCRFDPQNNKTNHLGFSSRWKRKFCWFGAVLVSELKRRSWETDLDF